MLESTTINKLIEMRLPAMADFFRQQMNDPSMQGTSFEDRVGMMVDREWSRRKSNTLTRLIRQAAFRYPDAAVENIEYHPDRKLDRDKILKLSNCNYVQEAHNIIVMGASGNGKSYISCALGVSACRNYFSTKYVRLPDLLIEMRVAKDEGIYQKIMKTYKKVKVLIIDEWLLHSLTEEQARDLLEIVEIRHLSGSTIFSTQFPPESWHEKIGQETLADAILDRIVHNSYKILIAGNISMRERHGLRD